MAMGKQSDAARRDAFFSDLERVKREDRRKRYRETTPAIRLESALRMSEFASELRSGLRVRGD
jgi:hypothetical protein